MLVLRVETIGDRFNGRGWGGWNYHQTNWNNLPPPERDGIAEEWRNNRHNVCATKSISQLKKWWKNIHEITPKKGARVAILEVHPKHVLWGSTQVVINRKKARIVGTLDSNFKPVITKPLRITKKVKL